MSSKNNLVHIDPVMKPNIPATLLKIGVGEACCFKLRDFAPLSSVQMAISRLRSEGKQYSVIEKLNNGESYTIARSEDLDRSPKS